MFLQVHNVRAGGGCRQRSRFIKRRLTPCLHGSNSAAARRIFATSIHDEYMYIYMLVGWLAGSTFLHDSARRKEWEVVSSRHAPTLMLFNEAQ